MVQPMIPKMFTQMLDKWEIKYGFINEKWSTHNRNHVGKWGPVHGVMMHHTGSDEQKSMRNLLWNGMANLPGPLCHAGIDVNGMVWLTGWGRTNHAGKGSKKVLDQVINENYAGKLYPSGPHSVDGNVYFYGFEIMYSGSKRMSVAQFKTSTRIAAGICAIHAWSAKSVIGHGEWQSGKWDPGISKGQIADMVAFREEVQKLIKSGPNPPVKPLPKVHVIKADDTLWKLAEMYLGDGNRWPEIVKKNEKKIMLEVNTRIEIPKK